MPPNWQLIPIGTNVTLIFPSNKNRIELAIQNVSSPAIYWDHSPSVTLGSGGQLLPYQTVILTETDGDLVHEPIYGIADDVDSSARIYEVTGQTVSWKKLLEMR